MIFLLVHGFNDRSAGKNNIDKCEPYLNNYGYAVDTDTANYGFFNYWAVRFLKRPAIRRIIKAVNEYPLNEQVTIMCYSNGANFVRKALPHFNRPVRIVFCSAALNRNAKFHNNLLKGWNFYIRNDIVVLLSSFIPFHPWGAMGALGTKKHDKRIMDIDYTDVGSRHGGMFKGDVIEMFVGRVHRLISGGVQ